MRPIPIVGYEAVCAAGPDVAAIEESLKAGRTGIAVGSSVLPAAECPVGEVKDGIEALPADIVAFDTRCNRLLASCVAGLAGTIDEVLDSFGPDRVGAVVGTSASGNTDLEAAYRKDGARDFGYHRRQSFGSAAALVRSLARVNGPAYTVSTACSSGANALISAAGLIEAGICDAVIAGSSDALCQTTYEGFKSLQVMDWTTCRPFDADRAGLNLGEGAAVLVLARERTGNPADGALFFAGFGASSDAHHMTAPDPDGIGAVISMRAALESAGIVPGDIGYLNLHGTGTRLNDESESRAVVKVFGRDLPCSSTKGYTGHMLGSAAGVEAVITLLALRSGRLWRNANLRSLDPAVEAGILESDEEDPGLRYAMSNSFAFGGNDTSLVFGIEP